MKSTVHAPPVINRTDVMHAPLHSRQRGGIIVLTTVWMVGFLMFIALGMNVFFLGTIVLQQRAAAEYIALAAVKTMVAPPTGGNCLVNNLTELGDINCIISTAEYAGAIPMMGAGYSLVLDPANESLTVTGLGDASCAAFQPGTVEAFPWCGFSAPSARGYVVLGSYNPVNGTFAPAVSGTVQDGTSTAAFVMLNLKNTNVAPLVMPLVQLFGGSAGIQFNSRAVAYTSGGRIRLAEDPMVQMNP